MNITHTRSCAYTHEHECTHTHVHTYTNLSVHIPMSIHTQIWVYTHTSAYTHEHGHTYMHVHTHTNMGTYTPTCIHTWTWTHRQKRTKKKEKWTYTFTVKYFSHKNPHSWNQPTCPHSYDHLEWRSPCFSSIALLISFYNVHSWISHRHWWWPIVQQDVKHPLHLIYTVIVLYSQVWGCIIDWMPDDKMKGEWTMEPSWNIFLAYHHLFAGYKGCHRTGKGARTEEV